MPQIRALAEMIFPKTYQDILSSKQISYMMEIMYHPNHLLNQMVQLKHHFLLVYDVSDQAIGFASYCGPLDDQVFKLHKIYLLPSCQGKGIGRILMNEICIQLRQNGAKILELNVNRENKALYFYEKLGFYRHQTLDIPIGEGFFMNDYLMRLDL
ncbi:MAG: GNAT family N-acetyltransferase [Chitinophagaceae bacterium]